MIRLTTALVALLSVFSPAYASLTPQSFPDRIHELAKCRLLAEALPCESRSSGELVVTDKTDVQMNGHACKYEDVPKNAEIILLELSKDKKMIQKIHFRTKRQPKAD